ncbi:hypothetical protein TrST_g13387, partial [Triparma strigata]
SQSLPSAGQDSKRHTEHIIIHLQAQAPSTGSKSTAKSADDDDVTLMTKEQKKLFLAAITEAKAVVLAKSLLQDYFVLDKLGWEPFSTYNNRNFDRWVLSSSISPNVTTSTKDIMEHSIRVIATGKYGEPELKKSSDELSNVIYFSGREAETLTESALLAHFAPHKVSSVTSPPNKDFGFLHFPSNSIAMNCLKLQYSTVNGVRMKLQLARIGSWLPGKETKEGRQGEKSSSSHLSEVLFFSGRTADTADVLTEDILYEYFLPYRVTRVRLMRIGYGFLNFPSVDYAPACLNAHPNGDSFIKGVTVKLEMKNRKTSSPSSPPPPPKHTPPTSSILFFNGRLADKAGVLTKETSSNTLNLSKYPKSTCPRETDGETTDSYTFPPLKPLQPAFTHMIQILTPTIY